MTSIVATPGPATSTTTKKKIPQQSADIDMREICKYIVEYQQKCGAKPVWQEINYWFEEQHPERVCQTQMCNERSSC
jgi:hypothetical protein